MKTLRSGISFILVLLLLVQIFPLSVFATASLDGANTYKNFVILGDSLCLGFSADMSAMTNMDTFDLLTNVYRAANGHDSNGNETNSYEHCYPTVFAKKVGIDTFRNNKVENLFTEGDAYDDVYNFGVCAAWSGDMYDMLSDPYYVYPYYSQNYDENTTFVLPKKFSGTRPIVINAPGNKYGVSSTGYDVANPYTWQFAQITNLGKEGFKADDRATWVVEPASAAETIKSVSFEFSMYTWTEDWVINYNEENYSLAKGTEINVAANLYTVIGQDYWYVGKKCLDEKGVIKDTNKDGKINNNDYYYYSNVNGVPTATESDIKRYGEPVQNPQFTRYYYPYVTDKIENGDLIALACGGNDIYHTFMDEYMANGMYNEDGSTNTLGSLIYWLNYALQMNISADDLTAMIGNPEMFSLFGVDTNANVNVEDLLATNDMIVAAENPEVENAGSVEIEEPTVDDLFGGIFTIENLAWLLDYYSSEKVTAYMKEEAIPNYKVNYEKCVQRLLELKDPSAELVLIGHYNPFGIKNYIEMMKQSMLNGELAKHLINDTSVISTLLSSMIGSSEDYEQLSTLDPEELASEISSNQIQLTNILNSDVDFNDMLKAIIDLSIPVTVLIMDRALGKTYEEFNGFVEKMGKKYNLAYVDVSDAPCANRYDPHPTAYGHEWIADRLYESVLPTITATSISDKTYDDCGCLVEEKFHGTILPNGIDGCGDKANALRFRLRDSQKYTITADPGYFIQAIFVDGESIYLADDPTFDIKADPNLKDIDQNNYGLIKAEYTFNDILASHKIEVQFGEYNGPKVYALEVLDSSAIYSGAGAYKAGVTVTLNAGSKDGYKFVAWSVQAGDAKLDNFYNPQATFVMPDEPVRVVAMWEVDKDKKVEPAKPEVEIIVIDRPIVVDPIKETSTTVKFNTNGGSSIPSVKVGFGEVVDLSYFVPKKPGYVFAGWYSDPQYRNPVKSLYCYTTQANLYAKWIRAGESYAICPKDYSCPIALFADSNPTAWYHDGVHYCIENGLMTGKSNTTFDPLGNTTRAMIVTILWRMEGCPAVKYGMTFKDVPEGQWYTDAIRWAQSTGVVTGFDADTFRPDAKITREQMATIMYRYARYTGNDTRFGNNLANYIDASKISTWALDGMRWANSVGLIQGRTNITLVPEGNITRAEVATIIQRFCTSFGMDYFMLCR